MDITEYPEIINFLNREYYSEENNKFTQWYENTYDRMQGALFKVDYHLHINETKKITWFHEWFIERYNNDELRQLNVLKDKYKTWTTNKGLKIRSLYPPNDPLKISIQNKVDLEAISFYKTIDHKEETIKNCKKIILQNNYTNLHIKIMGPHLTRIETAIEDELKNWAT